VPAFVGVFCKINELEMTLEKPAPIDPFSHHMAPIGGLRVPGLGRVGKRRLMFPTLVLACRIVKGTHSHTPKQISLSVV